MKIPENSFFDKLKLSIDDLIDDEQLSIGRVGHPFVVPRGYFASLLTSINKRIDLDLSSAPAGKMVRFIPKFNIWYGAAAVVVIVTLFTAVLFTTPSSTSVDELSREDILAYFEVEPPNYTEISTVGEFTEQDLVALTSNYLPTVMEDDEPYLESPESLLEEIKQLDEK